MIISKIEPQKNKQDRVNIFVDGEYFCSMQNFVRVKYNLKENLQTSHSFLTQLVMESDKESALNKVAKLLEHGLKTQKQIEIYLKNKGYDKFIIDYVIIKLKEYDYINDLKFAKSYVSTYSKKYGKRKLKYELQLKGVSQNDVLLATQDITNENEAVINIAQKYMRNKEINDKNLQKLSAHLLSKGFSWSNIGGVVSDYKKRGE